MDHVEDVTPHELRHAAIPNVTIDDLTCKNLLSLSVLTNFVRHAEEYGQTLTKLVAQAGGQGKAQISRAYNLLIDEGYLGRVEFGYARPEGDTGRSGRRATYAFVSRAPISDERLEEIIRQYTPGRYVMTHVSTGIVDHNGNEVYELRRVKVLSAEIYCARGAMRIDRDGLLTEHTKRRGGTKPRAEHSQPQRKPVPPEVEKSTSGGTSNDGTFSRVPPEVDSPESGNSTSIKKTNQEDQEDQGAVALADARLTAGAKSSSVGLHPGQSDGEIPEQPTTDSPGQGDHLTARACDDADPGPMNRDDVIQQPRKTPDDLLISLALAGERVILPSRLSHMSSNFSAN